MEVKSFALGAAALGMLGLSGLAAAASTTHQLNVSATVQGSCRFNSSGPTALSFGGIDPASTANAVANANVLFRCTSGTTSSVTKAGVNDSAGTHRVTDGSNFIPYTATLAGDVQVGTGYGAGQDKTLTVTGTITPTDFQNAPAGTYTDTLTLTIAP